jgi:hypothetical protein
MPSILDLVNEYYELERQKADAGGALEQAAELRLQCLKFFLEFDLGPPYAHMHQAHAEATEPAGAAYDEGLTAGAGSDEIPGAELTGIGSSPIPDDVPPAEAAGHSAFYDAVTPAAEPGQVVEPEPAEHAGGPLDVHDDVLNQTVDDFFSAHVEPPGAEAPVEATEIGPDEIESIPLEDEVPPEAPVVPAGIAAIDEAAPVPAAPASPVEWAAQLPDQPAAMAAAVPDLPALPGLDETLPPRSAQEAAPEPPAPVPVPMPDVPRAEPVPAPAPIGQWDAAVQFSAPERPEPAPAAPPVFDLPLTFEVTQPVAPPLRPGAAPTIPPTVSPAHAPVFEAAPVPAAAPAPAFVPGPAPIFVPTPQPAAEPPPPPVGLAYAISDPSRVTVHFLDGDVKRGIVRELGIDATDLCLFSMDEKSSDSFPVAALKAVFVIAQPGAKPTGGGGREMSVTFKDGRNLKGSSPDFNPGGRMFTLYPEPRQGNVDRVIVFKDATDEVK